MSTRMLLLADLLEYPTPELARRLTAALTTTSAREEAVDDLLRRFRDALVDDGERSLQEAYTRAFDFNAESAPYVGHHLFGEDMRRGAFMAHLKHRYRDLGLSDGTEVPDHFSAVLRFAARLEPGEEAEELREDCLVPAAARLQQALDRAASPYALVLEALSLTLRRPGEPALDRESSTCRPSSSSSSRT